MVKSNVKIDYTKLYKMFQALSDEVFLNDLGKTIVTAIKDLAEDNINVKGKPLLPYNPKYEKFKVKKGFTPLVNATLTGKMLRNLTFKVKSTKLIVYIKNLRNADNNAKMIKYFMGDYKNWEIYAIKGIVMDKVVKAIEDKMKEF